MSRDISINNASNSNFISGDVHGNVIVRSNNDFSTREIIEISSTINQLLSKLESDNPQATELEKIGYVDRHTSSDLKRRAIAAFVDGGETAFDQFVLENKFLKVGKSIIKGWIKSGKNN